MATGDLSQVLDLEQQCPSPRWTLEHFLVDFQSNAITRLVVSTPSQVVGFLACRMSLSTDCLAGEPREAKFRLPRKEDDAAPGESRQMTLLRLSVHRAWRRLGIGRTLLRRLERELQGPEDFIQAAVPESNLTLQLFLRAQGWRAEGILRGHYGDEAAYWMRRRSGR
jgi:ribosomal protein S18 acetylase RimI-like enzyme